MRSKVRPHALRSNRPLVPRLAATLRRGLPRYAAYLVGSGLVVWGASRSLGILDLRADQVALVNTLLLVFAGCFLLFLASHEQAVERAFPRERATG